MKCAAHRSALRIQEILGSDYEVQEFELPTRTVAEAAAAIVGEKITRADPDFVRERSGYAIGGVPPLGHRLFPVTVLDQDLSVFNEIWAAAGTPNAVFRLTPSDLQTLTGVDFHDVAQSED